mgnify:CR=1 FL=1
MAISYKTRIDLRKISWEFANAAGNAILDSSVKSLIFKNGINEQEYTKLSELKNAADTSEECLKKTIQQNDQEAALLDIVPVELKKGLLDRANKRLDEFLLKHEPAIQSNPINFAEYFAYCALKSFDKKDVAMWLPENSEKPEIIEALNEMAAPNLAKLCKYKMTLD